MKFGTSEISAMSDTDLTTAFFKCEQSDRQREEASQHPKFTSDKKKMELPPANPLFIQMKNEIEIEMKKRKLL